MKTLVSLITGRKDEPTFNTTDTLEILNWVRNYIYSGAEFDEDENIITPNDTFRIIDVEVIEFD